MLNPKMDAKYQEFMKKVLGESEPDEKGAVRALCDRRNDFVTLALSLAQWQSVDGGQKADNDEQMRAMIAVLNEIRHTPIVRRYLEKHPYFYTELDRAIYADLQSRKEGARFKGMGIA